MHRLKPKLTAYLSSKHLHLLGLAGAGGAAFVSSLLYLKPKGLSEEMEEVGSPYIYLDPKLDDALPYEGTLAGRIIRPSFFFRDPSESLESLFWRTVFVAKSKPSKGKLHALKSLLGLPTVQDYLLQEVAQTLDYDTAVEFARYPDCPSKFFLPLRPLHPSQVLEPLLKDLLCLLSALPKEGIGEYLMELVKVCLLNRFLNRYDREVDSTMGLDSVSSVDDDYFIRHRPPLPDIVQEICVLEALLGYSFIPGLREEMKSKGIMLLLHRTYNERKDNVFVVHLLARILANLSVEPSFHEIFFRAGWLRVVVEWLKEDSLVLKLSARRILSNMKIKSDYVDLNYESGVYLLSGISERYENPSADVVFVHGLLGSVVKTWRQNNLLKDGEKPPCPQCPHSSKCLHTHKDFSQCWPQDWLAKTFPDVRITALDYASQWTEWPKGRAQFEQEKSTTLERSQRFLTKLKAAKLGDRPIIWVCHSMGGLLVKQMLVLAAESSEPDVRSIYENTKGIVFLSVPHHGTTAAYYVAKWKLLVNPSVEVRELMKNNPRLHLLHQSFLKIAKNIDVLSIMENKSFNIRFNLGLTIVPDTAADPGIGKCYKVKESHFSICKPENESSVIYRMIRDFVAKCLELETYDKPPLYLDSKYIELFKNYQPAKEPPESSEVIT